MAENVDIEKLGGVNTEGEQRTKEYNLWANSITVVL